MLPQTCVPNKQPRPATTDLILKQLNASFLIIPDKWEARSIPVGHTIGAPAYLFSQIKPEREHEWREQFGGVEARKVKEEKAAKAAAKKADKERKKAKKAAAKEDTAGEGVGEGVEASEKGGKGSLPVEGTAVDEVAKGVAQTSLQSS
jgi:methionyl-tRNA synthetase